jgi:polyphosphate kinase 2
VAKKAKSGKAKGRLAKSEYEDRLEALQIELNRLARWLMHTGQRVLVLVEGRDTAGKGGVIGAIAEEMSPRHCRTVALTKPTERENAQWYFQRYVPHLPAAGEMVLFDRSWYNRAGVEPVMGYCTPEQTEAFLRQAPVFEKLLADDGIRIFKYWLCVDQAQQEERLAERLGDPLKRWKLSPVDLQARDKYVDYGKARDHMLRATHTAHAPWTLVDFNDQRRGRLTMIRHPLDQLPDVKLPALDIDFPPLAGAPKTERFRGPLKPIDSVA